MDEQTRVGATQLLTEQLMHGLLMAGASHEQALELVELAQATGREIAWRHANPFGESSIDGIKIDRLDITQGFMEHVHTEVMDTVFVRMRPRGSGTPHQSINVDDAMIDFDADGRVMGLAVTSSGHQHTPAIRPREKMDTPWGLFSGCCSCGWLSDGLEGPRSAWSSAQAHARDRNNARRPR